VHQVTGTGSAAVAEILAGPVRSGTVVGAHPAAAYLQLGSTDAKPSEAAQLVAIVRAEAVRLPCAVVLGPRQDVPASLKPGVAVQVGQGAIAWAGGRLTVTRWWTPDRVRDGRNTPPATRPGTDVLRSRVALLATRSGGHQLPDGVGSVIDAAAHALVLGAGDEAGQLLCSVLGRGPGLTPAADDATAGLLLTLRSLAVDDDALTAVEQAGDLVAEHAASRTTAVSAGLLAHARHGYGARQVVAAVAAMTGAAPDLEAAIGELVALGHTSGRDTGCGIAAGIEAHLSRRSQDTTPTAPTDLPPPGEPPARPSTPSTTREIA
jgi:hypothetical protein